MRFPFPSNLHCLIEAQNFPPPLIPTSNDPRWYIIKPLGYSYFPMELAPIPRSWVETTGNLVFWGQHEKVCHVKPRFQYWIAEQAIRLGILLHQKRQRHSSLIWSNSWTKYGWILLLTIDLWQTSLCQGFQHTGWTYTTHVTESMNQVKIAVL